MDETHETHQAHPTHLGKWSEPGVPHRGWTCTGVEDLEKAAQLCEMCESASVRYVHHMTHPDYPETLGVGCICAERMENDYVNPRAREQRLRSRARRRRTWPEREWRISARGNYYLRTEGFVLTVYEVCDRYGELFWRVRVTNGISGAAQTGRRRYPTAETAKLAALDALMWAKDKLV
jgi:hypothetical protein